MHFVATSATIAGARDDTDEQLRKFLADIAGVSPDRVSVVFGQPRVPPLPEAARREQPPLPDFDILSSYSPQELFKVLAANPRVCQLRSALIQQARPLSELARIAWRNDDVQARQKTLQLLDLCTEAVDDKNEALLPLRGHFFHRALNGLWACANAVCRGRHQTPLEDPWLGFW